MPLPKFVFFFGALFLFCYVSLTTTVARFLCRCFLAMLASALPISAWVLFQIPVLCNFLSSLLFPSSPSPLEGNNKSWSWSNHSRCSCGGKLAIQPSWTNCSRKDLGLCIQCSVVWSRAPSDTANLFIVKVCVFWAPRSLWKCDVLP